MSEGPTFSNTSLIGQRVAWFLDVKGSHGQGAVIPGPNFPIENRELIIREGGVLGQGKVIREVIATPIPSTMVLFGSGLFVLFGFRFSKQLSNDASWNMVKIVA